MKLLHFDDLSEINVPYGMLDDDTQKRMIESTEPVQYFSDYGIWKTVHDPMWTVGTTYRQKPGPLKIVRWVNVFPGGAGFNCTNRGDADEIPGNRIGVLRIEITGDTFEVFKEDL